MAMSNKMMEIKHYIISNPHARKYSHIACIFGVDHTFVSRAFMELGISPRSRPVYYVG